MHSRKFIAVPKEQRARAVQRLRRRRLHTINPVLRRGLQAGVPRSRDLEEVHEEVRKDHCESVGCVRRHREEGVPKPPEGGTNRTYLQQPTRITN